MRCCASTFPEICSTTGKQVESIHRFQNVVTFLHCSMHTYTYTHRVYIMRPHTCTNHYMRKVASTVGPDQGENTDFQNISQYYLYINSAPNSKHFTYYLINNRPRQDKPSNYTFYITSPSIFSGLKKEFQCRRIMENIYADTDISVIGQYQLIISAN